MIVGRDDAAVVVKASDLRIALEACEAALKAGDTK
jgi:hypothetical protein